MENVRSLPNKMDELVALTRHQREYSECSLLLFTETWLTVLTLDTAAQLEGFTFLRADRSKMSGKKGGGLAVFVNNRWCNPGHTTVKEQHCSKDIELLAVSVRPHYLPREFTYALAVIVYISPSANADAACDVLLSAVSRLQIQHPDALLLISGDFNHASPSSSLPKFTQYITCHTRDNKTLDLFYANTKGAYHSLPLPPLGRADHNLINTNKTKELVVDLRRRNNPPPAPVNILGTVVNVVKSFKYLGVHLNNNLDWTHNTDPLVKKGNSRLFLLRRLRSFGRQGPLLRTFYDSVVGSAIFHGIVCWSSSIMVRDRRRMDRLVRRASSVLGCPLDSVEIVGNGRMMVKLSSMLNNTSHPLQDTLTALGSSFSERLLHPCCVKERSLAIVNSLSSY
ncbi:hypothetical protein D4764_13G0012310 [Takifugu flavidus]|uniref:Endonuclease/exonuclease/phosphatase domain-containing protein n=1 Tax=Takifugu flavidus TaxID=433684 RepID=A0A5C6PC67_9TELE|nr:hypothetical protein D4764_13G0012310 [Takifugu flavidus]